MAENVHGIVSGKSLKDAFLYIYIVSIVYGMVHSNKVPPTDTIENHQTTIGLFSRAFFAGMSPRVQRSENYRRFSKNFDPVILSTFKSSYEWGKNEKIHSLALENKIVATARHTINLAQNCNARADKTSPESDPKTDPKTHPKVDRVVILRAFQDSYLLSAGDCRGAGRCSRSPVPAAASAGVWPITPNPLQPWGNALTPFLLPSPRRQGLFWPGSIRRPVDGQFYPLAGTRSHECY